MVYSAFLLNGAWEMAYCEEPYSATECPSFVGERVQNAVPGYWEDMTREFMKKDFFAQLRINPEYGIQKYPIGGKSCPDMALPTVVGTFFYRRTFSDVNAGSAAELSFGGVQSAVSVWLNGRFLGRHEGYSAPFSLTIPDGAWTDGENTVVLAVSNHRLAGFDGQPVSGITSRAASEYSGGITGDIALRVYESPLRDAAVLVSEDSCAVTVLPQTVGEAAVSWRVLDGETELFGGEACGEFSFSAEALTTWSPERPKLYTLELQCGASVLRRPFGVRRLTVDGVHFRLNGTPYYLRGVCEHCYYPETVHPTHDSAYYRTVVKKFKQLGFNYIRFHTHVPAEEYMQAADELGLLIQVESPNNATLGEWKEIVAFCRRHPSVVIYCCGNELMLSDDFLEHIRKCADEVHAQTDALFSPMSALRGFEYFLVEPGEEKNLVAEPFLHNPRKFAYAEDFTDLYNSYSLGHFSYESMKADVAAVNSWNPVFGKPRVTHEICIDGTYTDLSLKARYEGTRIGETAMFSSLEEHLREKGLLHNAPLYFRNSCEWQRRVRKHCFEAVRLCETVAGYDFLGPIDTHWHTFGYDVGMMNEFYELKPGETVRNVLMYNGETVLLHDLDKKVNFAGGETLACTFFASHYGETLTDATLTVRLFDGQQVIRRKEIAIPHLECGSLTALCDYREALPETDTPRAMKLSVTLEGGNVFAENEWELYLFPKTEFAAPQGLTVADRMTEQELTDALSRGENVVLFGAAPFASNATSFRIALAGRPGGNLATVIADHPIFRELPHEGYCGWQFVDLLEGGRAVVLEGDGVAFDPILDVASVHKNAIRQAALFEFSALGGKLLVCGLRFRDDDPAARWLKQQILAYAAGDVFAPKHTLDRRSLDSLLHQDAPTAAENTNFAYNPNDKTANRKSK